MPASAPTALRDCENAVISITAPDFPNLAESLQLARDHASETVIHTFETAGTWDDENAGFETRKYRVRGVDENGIAGAWSAWSDAVSLVSSVLNLAWNEPPETASGWTTLALSLTDSGETVNDCGDPVLAEGSCAGADPFDATLQLWIDGFDLTGIIESERTSGTPRNGVYELRFDSRLFAAGARELRAQAKGSDCCRAEISLPLIFDNSFDPGVRWWEVSAPAHATTGRVSIQNESLHVHPLRRYWVQNVICDQSATRATWLDANVDPETKNKAFEALFDELFVEMVPGGSGVTPTQAQWRGKGALTDDAETLFWVQRWTPTEHLATYNTHETRVVSLSPTGDPGIVSVFARSGPETGDGAAGRLHLYREGALEEEFDLTALGLGDARGVAWMDELNVVCVVRGSGNSASVHLLDLDAGQSRHRIALDSETRYPRFVARTEDSRLWLVMVNSSLSEARSALYTYAPLALVKRADVEETITFVAGVGTKLYFAAGAALWRVEGDATPSLVATFSTAVTAVAEIGEELLIGLDDGTVRNADGEVLVMLAAGSAHVGALATWTARDGEEPRAVAGGLGALLVERLNNGTPGGVWSDARALEIPASEPAPLRGDRVTALLEVVRVITPASGTPGQPGFVPERSERELLIGTQSDDPNSSAALFVLRLAPPQHMKHALLCSRISHPAFETI